jgi:hypothetical protein
MFPVAKCGIVRSMEEEIENPSITNEDFRVIQTTKI